MTCPNCFHILPEDSKFCQYCGVRINVVDNNNGIAIDDSSQHYIFPRIALKKAIAVISPQSHLFRKLLYLQIMMNQRRKIKR